MPSCSNSSNISSSFNTINVSQNSVSSGSRFLIQIDNVAGLTIGNVIRYDVPTGGYTASRANAPENAEVVGIIESYDSAINKFNVVLGGSIKLDSSKFASISSTPAGAAGGNDIYFLSGVTAGILQNLAPSDVSHITKPIYQVAPHGNGAYTGTVINYSGYRLGGDIQAGLDTINVISQIGALQLRIASANESNNPSSSDEQLLYTYGSGTEGIVRPLFLLGITQAYDWRLEYINATDKSYILRLIDFPEASYGVLNIFNDGWIERLRMDESSPALTREQIIGKQIRQKLHGGFYSQNPNDFIELQWYGQVIDYDPNNRLLYIQRPAYPANNLWTELMPGLLAETSPTSNSQGYMQLCNGTTPSDSIFATIRVTTTDTRYQFFGFITPQLRIINDLNNLPNYPFDVQVSYDPFSISPYYTTEYINPKVYIKIKNKGLGVFIPDSINTKGVTISPDNSPAVNILTKLAEYETRIADLERQIGVPI